MGGQRGAIQVVKGQRYFARLGAQTGPRRHNLLGRRLDPGSPEPRSAPPATERAPARTAHTRMVCADSLGEWPGRGLVQQGEGVKR